MLVDERPGGACVVEVDVREQHRPEIGDRETRAGQRGAQRRQRARRPGIDDRRAARPVHDDGRDDARDAEKIEIEVREA
jgi:hypothetical protein